MILNLDERQNADRERTGACVVPGERVRCSKCEIVFDHYCPDCTYVPPRQFSDAAAPCQTIDGIPIDPAVLAGVTETRGGKPIIEIRVFDPGVRFKRSSLRLVAAFVTVVRRRTESFANPLTCG